MNSLPWFVTNRGSFLLIANFKHIFIVISKIMRNFATSKVRNEAMCTVTLSYNEKDKAASEKLAALLSTGLFVQLNRQEDLDIDYEDSTLYVDSVPLPEDKEYYTPEELRSLLISDINEIYGVKDAL